MRTIRRLYFYLVAFISLEVVLWGLIGLLRSIISTAIVDMADTLAQALALVLVGVPIFLFHWIWVQRTSAQDDEEGIAHIRAVFFYAVLLSTLIPVVQNLLALVSRSLLVLAEIDPSRAILGGSQTWQDNLIAILINAIAAGYIWKTLQETWKSLPAFYNFADVRRLYRFIWLLYSLSLVVFGAQQVLRFIFYLPAPENVLGAGRQEILANGVALLLAGTPIWFYAWRICQEALSAVSERKSNLRLGVLYLLSLGGVITVISTGGLLLDLLLRWAFGKSLLGYELINKAGGPISLGLPLALVWVYFSGWLKEQIRSDTSEIRRSGKRRFYFYILSAIGLGTAFTGVALLFSFVIDTTTSSALWGETLRTRLAAALSTLIIGLPLWLVTWRPMQVEALSADDLGDHARRSTLRRAYLYLALFAGVIGGMVSAVWFMYTLFNAMLTGGTSSDFISTLLNSAQLLVLFGVLLLYHLRHLQQDSNRAAQTLELRQQEFLVIVIDSGDEGYLNTLESAMRRHAPGVPLVIQAMDKGLSKNAGGAKAVIIPVSAALNPSPKLRNWLRTFKGEKLVVTQPAPGWIMNAFTPEQAAKAARQLAEGEPIQLSRPSTAWETIKIIAVIWLGIQLLFAALAIGISLLAG
jgi:hypothetical protein